MDKPRAIEDTKYKPDIMKITSILKDEPTDRIKFILDFTSSVIDRLKNGTLSGYNWPEIADELGILDKVSKIIDAFDVPESEFYAKWGRNKQGEDAQG